MKYISFTHPYPGQLPELMHTVLASNLRLKNKFKNLMLCKTQCKRKQSSLCIKQLSLPSLRTWQPCAWLFLFLPEEFWNLWGGHLKHSVNTLAVLPKGEPRSLHWPQRFTGESVISSHLCKDLCLYSNDFIFGLFIVNCINCSWIRDWGEVSQLPHKSPTP